MQNDDERLIPETISDLNEGEDPIAANKASRDEFELDQLVHDAFSQVKLEQSAYDRVLANLLAYQSVRESQATDAADAALDEVDATVDDLLGASDVSVLVVSEDGDADLDAQSAVGSTGMPEDGSSRLVEPSTDAPSVLRRAKDGLSQEAVSIDAPSLGAYYKEGAIWSSEELKASVSVGATKLPEPDVASDQAGPVKSPGTAGESEAPKTPAHKKAGVSVQPESAAQQKDDATERPESATQQKGDATERPHTVIRLRDVRRRKRRRVLLPLAAALILALGGVVVFGAMGARPAATSVERADMETEELTDTAEDSSTSKKETAKSNDRPLADTAEAGESANESARPTTLSDEAAEEQASDAAAEADEASESLSAESTDDRKSKETKSESEEDDYVDPYDPTQSQVSVYTTVKMASGSMLSTLVAEGEPQYVDEGSLSMFAGFAEATDETGNTVECEVYATSSWMEYPYAVRYEGEEGYWLAKTQRVTSASERGLTK